MMEDKFQKVQHQIDRSNIDGWLLYDFRKSNDLACKFLEIPSSSMLTRRMLYWIPRCGTPIKIVHCIENQVLKHLPGIEKPYSSWDEFHERLAEVLSGCKKVAMEYSTYNQIPTVSKVDAGTIEMIRSFDVEVVSSADLLQQYTSVWSSNQLEMHLAAAEVLDKTVNEAWIWIRDSIKKGKTISEYDVQKYILDSFAKNECISDDPPICAVNAHSADPHYSVNSSSASAIKQGDFILIDLSCKKNVPGAVYADITRVGIAASHPEKCHMEIFDIVKKARDEAMVFLKKRLDEGMAVMGCEVDQVCRNVIVNAGYGAYFTHRTGHNIGERVHGDGTNIDNFETHDFRTLLPETCFSIEPGIYLPGKFGIRLEHDVFIEPDGRHARVTGGLQEKIVCLLE